MNKITTSPSIQRFEQKFTEQAKLDKVAMQRHKIFVVAAGVAAAVFAVAMIAAVPAIILIAGGTLLAATAAIVTSVALGVLASCAFAFALSRYYKREELKENLDLQFLLTVSGVLYEKTSSAINSLIRYGLVSEELEGELTAFNKRLEESQMFKKGFWNQYPNIKDEKQKKLAEDKFDAWENLKTEWFNLFARIQKEGPFPVLEEKKAGIESKSRATCDYRSAQDAAAKLLSQI